MTWLVTSAYAEDAVPAATSVEPAAGVPAATEAGHAPDATHTEVGHADAGHKGPFPPFDTSTFPSQIFWFVICFGVLYILMKRVITPRIASIVEGRAERIAKDIEEAQRLRVSSDTALAAYEKALAEARGSAHTIAQTATDEAKAAAESRRLEIEAELSSKLATAEAHIGEIKTKALADVDAIAHEATTAVVKALLGHDVGADEVKAAVSAVSTK